VFACAANLKQIPAATRKTLDGTESADEDIPEPISVEEPAPEVSTNEEDGGPVALVLQSDHLMHKINANVPFNNYEGREFSLALGTETLLCSASKVAGNMLPRACYVFGVVCVSGPCHLGPYKFRSYFDPWVVLPQPVQSSRAWGQGLVHVEKVSEHLQVYHLVKQIVAELQRAPVYKQPTPTPQRAEPKESTEVSAVLKSEKLALEVDLLIVQRKSQWVCVAARKFGLEGASQGMLAYDCDQVST
jgi:hypothetical protein